MKVLNDLIEATEKVDAARNEFKALYLSRFKLVYNLLAFVENGGHVDAKFVSWDLEFWPNDGPMFILHGMYPGEHYDQTEQYISAADLIENWTTWFSRTKTAEAAIKENREMENAQSKKAIEERERKEYLKLKEKFEGHE